MKNYMKQGMNKLLLYQYFTFTLGGNHYKQRFSWSSKTHTTKFPYDKTSVRRICFTVKFPYSEILARQNFLRRNFLTAKFPYGEISLRRNFLTAKLSYGKISLRWNFLTAKIPTTKIPTVKFPSARASKFLFGRGIVFGEGEATFALQIRNVVETN